MTSMSRPTTLKALAQLVARNGVERPTRGHGVASGATVDAQTAWRVTSGLALAIQQHVESHGPANVGLLTGRSPLGLPAFLAVQMSGATAVLLDEQHPAKRLRAIADDASIDLIVSESPVPWAADLPVLAPSQCMPASSGFDWAVSDRPAYVIFTSGTTGRPRGVVVSRRALDVFMHALSSIPLPTGGSGLVAVSPGFDGWLWCALLHGSLSQTLHYVDLKEVMLDDALRRIRPTILCLTPSLLDTSSEAVNAQVVVSAGERLSPVLAQKLADRTRLLNVYGPTEATIAATCADSARGDVIEQIGHPLVGYEVEVVGADDRLLPAGVAGELVIGGPAVADGYLGAPELTSSKFRPCLAGNRSVTMYRTGDLGKKNADGSLEYLGRADAQVKVRGLRVELREVELLAEQVPGVSQAVAFVRQETSSLELAIVLNRDSLMEPDLVRLHLAERLPAGGVPSRVTALDRLPASDRGKVDMTALIRTTQVSGPAGGDPDDWSTRMRGHWAALLGHSAFSEDDSFFDVGGHSLLAARLITRIRKREGRQVSIRSLYEAPTLAALASTVASAPLVYSVAPLADPAEKPC